MDELACRQMVPQAFAAANGPAGSFGAPQGSTVVEELLTSNRLMLQQMQTLADAAQKAAAAAEEAARAAAEKSDGFRSAGSQEACEKGDRKTEAKPLTAERLREHTRSHRAASPAERCAQQKQQQQPPNQQAESQNMDQFHQARERDVVGAWSVLYPIEQGVTKIEFKDYFGLAIGEIVEIYFATSSAEVITVIKFGSVIASAPTRFAHAAGAPVLRLIEGNGARYTPASSEINATPISRPRSSMPDETFVERESWSPRERD